jgi:hypothetical protein
MLGSRTGYAILQLESIFFKMPITKICFTWPPSLPGWEKTAIVFVIFGNINNAPLFRSGIFDKPITFEKETTPITKNSQCKKLTGIIFL